MTAPGQSHHPISMGPPIGRLAGPPPFRVLVARWLETLELSRADLAGVLGCASTFTVWNAMAREALVPGVAVFFALLCLACLLAGRLFARMLPGDAARDFPTVFVVGFLLLNSALYVLAWVSPLSIVENACGLLVAVGFAYMAAVGRARRRGGHAAAPAAAFGSNPSGTATATFTLAIGLAAATLWCWDSITPQLLYREGVLLKPFFDSSFHACEIRMFRDAHGAATLDDLRMAGQPVWIYHHASYMAPALVSAATGTSAYLAYGSFYVPSGVLLSGLAAYALARSLWGSGSGLAAMTALLLIPSPAHVGLHNHWLSYRWLQQVAPGGYTGVSVLAIAWLLMFAGCRTGRIRLVVLGFLAAGLSANYKAHFFVANALIIWLYPGLFFRGVRWPRKLAWLGFALGCFVAVAAVAQQIDAVPTLRLDCSSVKHFMAATTAWCEYEGVRKRCKALFSPTTSLSHDLAWGAALLFYGALGFMGLANVALAVVAVVRPRDRNGRRRVELEYVIFPFVIILNYLVMALGLAYDSHRPEHGDELRHRPLVWAYFVTAAWAGALAYRLLLEEASARWPRLRGVLIAAVVMLLYVPHRLGPGIQAPSLQWRSYAFRSYPRGLYEGARYILTTAEPDDVVQVSDEDPLFVFSALCERRAYAIAYFEGKQVPALKARIDELDHFRALTDARAIRRFASRRGIRYYVLHPDTKVAWPDEILDRPDFAWGGIRVYSFRARPAPG